jgi:hypothetical protein
MKMICITAVAILLAACSTHQLRCRGALEPINGPAPAKERKYGSAREPNGVSPKGAPAEGRP